jgi:hypothetical protein
VPRLCDAIWQAVIGLGIPLGELGSSEEWQIAMRKDRGVICPQRIADKASLYSAIDYLTAIKAKVSGLRNNAEHADDRRVAESPSNYDAYLSALDFFYHVSGAKGDSKALANKANRLVSDRYMNKIYDAKSGQRVPSPYVSVETVGSNGEGPDKEQGTRFVGSEVGLTLTFWNIRGLLSDKDFVPFILSQVKSAERPSEANNGR